MFDLTTESSIPLAAAAALVPPGRNGKKTHISTLLRWIRDGAKGPGGERVRLEAVRLGGRWLTTRGALQRFGEGLTPRHHSAGCRPPPRAAGQRSQACEEAGRELDRIGI